VLGEPIVDRRTKRREATRQEIVEAAWGLARENGLAGVSLRDLGKRVGMQAPSLYSYFPSKAAIYDAMFGEGTRAFVERLRTLDVPCDPAPLAMCAQSWPITCASWSMRVGGRYWSVTRAPKGASASSMALVMAAGAPIIPPSPMPRKSFSPGLSVWR